MEKLRTFLNDLPTKDQEAFADRCGTSVGYLRKAMAIGQQLGEKLVISIERESKGKVRCEDLRPDVDWQFLRNTA